MFLRIAEKDAFRWNKYLPEFTERLETAGAHVDGALVPGARHTFRLNWEELDAWLGTLGSPPENRVPTGMNQKLSDSIQ